jgi:hypothetical protein
VSAVAGGLLVAGATGPVAAQVPKVYLNHVVTVVDSETYAALGRSAFLKDTLGRLAQYTIAAGGGGGGASWTGSYFFGKNTYVELFAPGGVAGPAGVGMISYGVEQQGSLWQVRKRLARATGEPIDSLLRYRAREGGEVPWFYAVSVHGVMTGSALPTWVMEYHPAHNRRWDPSIPPGWDGIMRWQAIASEFDRNRPLLDVVGVTVAVSDADRARIVAEGGALGFRLDGDRMTGPGFVIQLEPATETARGVRAVELRLGRPVTPGVRPIGPRSDLTVTGATGTWSFR